MEQEELTITTGIAVAEAKRKIYFVVIIVLRTCM
jgi:hypothetical protein